LLKWVYSMIPLFQINIFLYKTEAGKTEWGVGGREGERKRGREGEREREVEREREKEIRGLRE
jgi:hypothetical protein